MCVICFLMSLFEFILNWTNGEWFEFFLKKGTQGPEVTLVRLRRPGAESERRAFTCDYESVIIKLLLIVHFFGRFVLSSVITALSIDSRHY